MLDLYALKSGFVCFNIFFPYEGVLQNFVELPIQMGFHALLCFVFFLFLGWGGWLNQYHSRYMTQNYLASLIYSTHRV